MKIYKFLLTSFFSIGILLSTYGQGLSAFQALPDNAFVEPNLGYFRAIDVLANDYFFSENGCDRDDLEVTIKTQGTLGFAVVNGDNQVEYMPFANKAGKDKVEYEIYCEETGESSSTFIYINVNDKPDVVSDKDCYVDPTGIKFEMKELVRTDGMDVNSLSNVICGDLDGDGNIEMLVFNHNKPESPSNGYPNKILVFRMNKDNQIERMDNYTIDLPYKHYHNPYGNFLIANVNGNQYASIFYVFDGVSIGSGPILIKYSYDESQAKYIEEARVLVTTNTLYRNLIPHIADLMGDGNQQICLVDKVFSAKDLTLLADGGFIPATSVKSSYSFGVGAHNPNLILLNFASSLITADIDDDGIMEIIGGDYIYKVNITDYTGTAGNSFSFFRQANKTGRTDIFDGHTAIADMDMDGKLDVIVTCKERNNTFSNAPVSDYNGYLYIYNPRTGEVIHSNKMPIPLNAGGTSGPSRPFVGDLDGDVDGIPEIALTAYLHLGAYKYNKDTKQLNEMWKLSTTDNSASTTLSLFDFGQQGFAQLVYRDETDLRIIDGRVKDENGVVITDAKRTLETFRNVQSATTNEYPIVADVNGDGAAEIIVTGIDDYSNAADFRGQLRVYGAKGTDKWAPARPVWNQLAYNPVYVNNDLTIPANPINPSTAFISPDGTKNRPFNNFLQQATDLNKEGTMIMLGPDLLFDPRVPKQIRIDDVANTLQITVGVMNQGDAMFNGSIRLQLYAHRADGSYTTVGTAYVAPNTGGLTHTSPNNTTKISYTIANNLPSDYTDLVMTVNLSTPPGNPINEFSGSAECHGGINNFTSGFSIVTGSRVICEGATEAVEISPKGEYTVRWYKQAKGGAILHTGDSFTVTKNADPVEYYFVETYKTASSPSPITTIRDTIFVYRTPDSLVWSGVGGTQDWHDHLNWTNPDADYPKLANIPRPCTNVLIPSGVNIYPNLAPAGTLPTTEYAVYAKSECNNIRFAFGGEVVRPDKLEYTKAYVDVTFNSHRWYMFAPPLTDFYSGDIYRNSIIPFYDDVKAYTKMWARRNPLTNYYTHGWTGLFNTPDINFKAGQALGVWISDKAIEGQPIPPRDPFGFKFPKSDPQFIIYQENTDIPEPTEPVYPTTRTKNHRFIFDGATEGTNFNLQIDGEVKTVGQMVLIGNPFLSHLDFDKFYAANSSFIQNHYSILDENATMQYYNRGASTLTKNIAPMQAFLVEIKAPFTNLVANGLMTLSVPGSKLKTQGVSSSTLDENNFILKVIATQNGYANQAYIEFRDDATNAYLAGEDIAGLFPQKASSDSRALSVYSLTADGTKVAVNRLATDQLDSKVIPLGVWSSKKEPLTINISNLDRVPAGYDLYLYDKLMNTSHNLKVNSMVTFDKIAMDKNAFLDDRFSLQFKKGSSSIDEEQTIDNIAAFVTNGTLHLSANENLETVDVYNIQGQLLFSKRLNTTTSEYSLPYASLYIVKIKSGNNVTVKKLLNN